ncbi:uncharacterized protein LOC111023512 [Momordica charantia]|uniref:Uncharacterized protein LOC111023512 n=1 Tax=Momordica charantia TaxID=3673 RepID=A0A6J1DSJ6_MOMCH|nr:uncharacterized protein LOC111023512 [Momordica charantia]
METLQTLVQTTVSNQMTQLTQNRGSISIEAKYLRDFKKYDPRSFDGLSVDPMLAEAWLSLMETIFRYMRCLEEQKVQCDVFMLKDDAFLWWESTERPIDVSGGPVTWLQFKEAFFQQYYPAITWYRKQVEFLNLKQDNRSVEEYDREFTKLSRFAPELVDTEATKCERFIIDLKDENKGFVATLSPPDYATALRTAALIDNRSASGSQVPLGPGSSL